jgi:hypothetical protein
MLRPPRASEGDLLHVLATEIWPLLADRALITKAELERILDDPTAT